MRQYDYIFPTPVMASSLDINNEEIERLILDNSKEELKKRNWITTQDDLFEIPVFENFVVELKKEVEHYCQEMLLINYKNLELSSLWANVHTKQSQHDLHMHSNSFVSGVYYVKVPDTRSDEGDIVFADPRDVREIFMTDHTDPNDKKVTRMYQYKPKNGLLLLFPSWLKHKVIPFSLDDDYRISVSFNFILTKSTLITRSFSYKK